jgi:hypothetical protein
MSGEYDGCWHGDAGMEKTDMDDINERKGLCL